MGKHAKPEEIVAKLRQFEVLTAQGVNAALKVPRTAEVKILTFAGQAAGLR